MYKNYYDSLLKLVCAKDCSSFLDKLNQIKEKKLADLKLSTSDQEIVAQILLLDQLSLAAACQTISGCWVAKIEMTDGTKMDVVHKIEDG